MKKGVKTIFRLVIILLLFAPFFVWAGEIRVENMLAGEYSEALNVEDNTISLKVPKIWEDAGRNRSMRWAADWSGVANPAQTFEILFDNDLNRDVLEFRNNGGDEGKGFRGRFTEVQCFNFQWKMKADAKVYYYFEGQRKNETPSYFYIRYSTVEQKRFTSDARGIYVFQPLSPEINNNTWKTITRNFIDDLRDVGVGNTEIKSINTLGIALERNHLLRFVDLKSFCSNEDYVSTMFDLGEGELAAFENVSWNENKPEGTSINLMTRTSNDQNIWSDWQEVNDGQIRSPLNRYLQFKISFDQNGDNSEPASVANIKILYDRKPNKITHLEPDITRTLSDDDELLWLNAGDPDGDDEIISYIVELDDNPDFTFVDSKTEGILETKLKLKELKNYNKLDNNKEYYWRVGAMSQKGATSDFSDIGRSFILNRQNLNPESPKTGFGPKSGAVIKEKQPIIYWQQATDPDKEEDPTGLSYIIDLSTDDNFNHFKRFETGAGATEFKLPEELEDNAMWHYRIRTKDSKGGLSEWSETQSFFVAAKGKPELFIGKTVGINKEYNTAFLQNKMSFALALASFGCLSLVILPIRRKKYQFDGATKTKTDVEALVRIRTRTKTLITLGIIGALAAAGIFIYSREQNPSPLQDNGKRVKENDVLTYRIDYKNTGKMEVKNLIILDNFPEGTEYVADSSLVNGEKQTDIADQDKVSLDANKIAFSIGNLTSDQAGFVAFKAKVSSDDAASVNNEADVLFDGSEGLKKTDKTINPVEKQEETKIEVNQVNTDVAVYGKGVGFNFLKLPPKDSYFITVKKIKEEKRNLTQAVEMGWEITTNLSTLPANSFDVLLSFKYNKGMLKAADIKKNQAKLFVKTNQGWQKLKAKHQKKQRKFVVRFNRFDKEKTIIVIGKK